MKLKVGTELNTLTDRLERKFLCMLNLTSMCETYVHRYLIVAVGAISSFSYVQFVPYFGGRSLDTDPDLGQYWPFCGTIINLLIKTNIIRYQSLAKTKMRVLE